MAYTCVCITFPSTGLCLNKTSVPSPFCPVARTRGGFLGGGHSCNPAYQLQPLLLKRNDRKNGWEKKNEMEPHGEVDLWWKEELFMDSLKSGKLLGVGPNRGLCQWRKILVLFFDQNSEWYLYFKPCSRAWEVDVWTVSRRRISSYPHRRGWSGLQPPVRSPILQTTMSGQPQYLAVKRNRRTHILAPFWPRQKAV